MSEKLTEIRAAIEAERRKAVWQSEATVLDILLDMVCELERIEAAERKPKMLVECLETDAEGRAIARRIWVETIFAAPLEPSEPLKPHGGATGAQGGLSQ